MDDVNPIVDAAPVADATPAATVEPDTTQPDSPQVNQTAEPVVPERSIPYKRFAEVNNNYKEAQRKLAQYEAQSKLGQYSEDDMGAVMNHPYVQELLIKQAKYELTDFAKGKLDERPDIPETVKKAILTNVRGFVKETTTDVESAKIDIEEYIENNFPMGVPAQQQPKTFPVASTKAQEATPGANPLDVQQILDKPVDEWTPDEAKLVKQYKKSMPKR
jgi:hypothetical protein